MSSTRRSIYFHLMPLKMVLFSHFLCRFQRFWWERGHDCMCEYDSGVEKYIQYEENSRVHSKLILSGLFFDTNRKTEQNDFSMEFVHK